MTDRKKISIYTLFVAVVLAVVIDWQAPQNFDTAVRVWTLTQPWSVFVHNMAAIELAPPLWHVLARVIVAISPISVILTLRLFNLALFVLMVPLGYWAGNMLGNRQIGWGTALLLPWSLSLVRFITRVDHYILYATLALLYTASLAALLRQPTRKRALFYTGTTAAFAFTHYYALVYIGSTVLLVLACHLWTHDRDIVVRATVDDLRTQRVALSSWARSPSLVPIGVSLLPVVLLYVAWFPVLFQQYMHYRTSYDPAYSTASALLKTAVTFLYRQLPTFAHGLVPGIITLLVVTVPLGVLGLVAISRERDRVQLITVGGAVVAALVLLVGGQFYSPRHGLWLAAIAPLVVGLGIGQLATAISTRQFSARRNRRIFSLGVLVLLAVSAGPAVVSLSQPVEHKTNITRAVDIVQTEYASDSVILSVSPWGEMILRAHGVEAPVYGIPEDAVDGNRAYIVRSDYDPDSYPNDFRRVKAVVSGKDTVIVFNAHGTIQQRLSPLRQDLQQLGYTVRREYQKGDNGVIVFRKKK